jgi:hypothetical protein
MAKKIQDTVYTDATFQSSKTSGDENMCALHSMPPTLFGTDVHKNLILQNTSLQCF